MTALQTRHSSFDISKQTMYEYGSFKDSRKSPIHRWFMYPAGYSHKLVEAMIRRYNMDKNSLLVDPFLGSGTTTLAASHIGIKSIGVEAHPFVAWVAKTKCAKWNVSRLESEYEKLTSEIRYDVGNFTSTVKYPDLIYKCFSKKTLSTLEKIHNAVKVVNFGKDFFKLALVATLRNVSTAGTGWPYIAPSEHAKKTPKVDAVTAFDNQCRLMLNYVSQYDQKADARVVLGDSRNISSYMNGQEADLIITSPPYLNNYDYADRTRFETYFLGMYENWGEITKHVRDKLITAATTQVSVSKDMEKAKMPTVKDLSTTIHSDISRLISHMSDMRNIKPGKKRYDIMTGGYFEDLSKVMIEMYEIMPKNGHAIMVLGDSAPYGVHVPTDVLIGRIGKAIGFKQYKIKVLRERGGKWRSNPQRHHVELRETITTLTK
ncbi:MAG: DNA methyltransferase [Thaumarchaeota archaeon]|nr:DNA methyltransferase [Nitrososphaerota archaeon]